MKTTIKVIFIALVAVCASTISSAAERLLSL